LRSDSVCTGPACRRLAQPPVGTFAKPLTRVCNPGDIRWRQQDGYAVAPSGQRSARICDAI